ncbi:MAG TPA: glycerol-3-phosphate acyltransferase [Candidatus Acutalibacter pullicola]|uniref:Glycerol-3-phosphate acyltransferase n=1 Tax=Candidatus Acutalibacter pullicola TaxID=2838417 RepID=A0A9D2SG08_9FIRM|nr:glycerol-3-phosphate acyltransferase [Candidatus Acutalibacter pullicola]
MGRTVVFTVLGYLSGSLLFARYWGKWCRGRNVVEESPDQNPGTFNAFQYGGFVCGTLTLCGDLLKGFLPVFLYCRERPWELGLALVLAAPVWGHVLPLYHGFRGGKGVAVTFGCLLGLLPKRRPLLLLAFVFLFFSLVVKITPNYHRTLAAYVAAALGMVLFVPDPGVALGFGLISVVVIGKLLHSTERKESCKVEIVWKR